MDLPIQLFRKNGFAINVGRNFQGKNMDEKIKALQDALKKADDIKIIELDFQYKDNEESIRTFAFGADKVINIY